MKFEWDENKCESNIHKHGVDFADLEPLFQGETVTIIDDRYDYGEDRFVTLGLLNGVVIVVVHTEADDTIRIISARKATSYEEESYFKEITYGLESTEDDEREGDRSVRQSGADSGNVRTSRSAPWTETRKKQDSTYHPARPGCAGMVSQPGARLPNKDQLITAGIYGGS
jgi:uncharacterized DUF497 family protein